MLQAVLGDAQLDGDHNIISLHVMNIYVYHDVQTFYIMNTEETSENIFTYRIVTNL